MYIMAKKNYKKNYKFVKSFISDKTVKKLRMSKHKKKYLHFF